MEGFPFSVQLCYLIGCRLNRFRRYGSLPVSLAQGLYRWDSPVELVSHQHDLLSLVFLLASTHACIDWFLWKELGLLRRWPLFLRPFYLHTCIDYLWLEQELKPTWPPSSLCAPLASTTPCIDWILCWIFSADIASFFLCPFWLLAIWEGLGWGVSCIFFVLDSKNLWNWFFSDLWAFNYSCELFVHLPHYFRQ